MIKPDDIQQIIGPDGIFSKTISGYETREQQIDMSLAVADALNNRHLLLAEAGTGIGKTMAYLAPVLQSAGEGMISVISTNTINLQNQLINKDIPSLFKDSGISYTLVKGRGNYVCLLETDHAAGSILMQDDPSFERFLKWLKKTKTGDREEIGFDFPYWHDVKSDIHTCQRKDCPYYAGNRCFYYNMRMKAAASCVIVTNHALFFSDLAVKLSKGAGTPFAESDMNDFAGILPEYSNVIFDEAHHLEEVASNVFGSEITNVSVPFLVKRIKNHPEFEISESLLKTLADSSEALFNSIASDKPDYFLADVKDDTLMQAARNLTEQLKVLKQSLSESKANAEEKETSLRIDSFTDITDEYINSVDEIFFNDSGESFRWGERRDSERYPMSVVHSTPVSVSEALGEALFSRLDLAFVLTSATLRCREDFSFIKSRLGIEDSERIRESFFDSPFNYKEQMLLYVPRNTPEPRDTPEYARILADQIKSLLEITRGGAFLLFTSYSMLNRVFALLKDHEDYVFLRQGEMSNQQLLKAFMSDRTTCLMGTSGFWEGIDVPGSRLRLVVLDKIPFPVPSNPTVKARSDYLQEQGKNPFTEYSLPEAIIKLKQGMGRLIRTKEDKGIVAILDSRLHRRSYKKDIFKSIPKCKGVTETDRVRDWADARLDIDQITDNKGDIPKK